MTSEQIALALLAALVLLPVILLVLWLRARRRARRASQELAAATAERDRLQERYAPVADVDAEVELAQAERDKIATDIARLQNEYAAKWRHYDRLRGEVAIFDERLAFAEMGVYEPHFEFDDSEAYKAAIAAAREEQKRMVSAKTAVVCPTEWTVEGSKAKGRTMTSRAIKLTLRAFNNECEAAIANTRWNNVNAMEKRITRAAEQIDGLNASSHVSITRPYVDQKLKELWLTHEYRERIKAERDERAEAARLTREEQKLQRDAERAEAEEERYQALLEAARREAAGAVGAQVERHHEKIAELKRQLAEAHEKAERAQAMAERTRSGYVYIISNVGSFGDGVVKIGLTRRLDPIDRVRELGDASVPFLFDTHAMIYAEDAPALEHALHAEFADRRVNTANPRKEFFRASLDEVEDAVRRLAPEAAFFRDIEAQEYRETLARRKEAVAQGELADDALPAAI